MYCKKNIPDEEQLQYRVLGTEATQSTLRLLLLTYFFPSLGKSSKPLKGWKADILRTPLGVHAHEENTELLIDRL